MEEKEMAMRVVEKTLSQRESMIITKEQELTNKQALIDDRNAQIERTIKQLRKEGGNI